MIDEIWNILTVTYSRRFQVISYYTAKFIINIYYLNLLLTLYYICTKFPQ